MLWQTNNSSVCQESYQDGTSKLFTSGPDILNSAPSVNNAGRGIHSHDPKLLFLVGGNTHELD